MKTSKTKTAAKPKTGRDSLDRKIEKMPQHDANSFLRTGKTLPELFIHEIAREWSVLSMLRLGCSSPEWKTTTEPHYAKRYERFKKLFGEFAAAAVEAGNADYLHRLAEAVKNVTHRTGSPQITHGMKLRSHIGAMRKKPETKKLPPRNGDVFAIKMTVGGPTPVNCVKTAREFNKSLPSNQCCDQRTTPRAVAAICKRHGYKRVDAGRPKE